jgi:hypothetical protein
MGNPSLPLHVFAGLILIAILAASAHGQKMSELNKCLQSVDDARVNLTKTEDTGRPGAKVEKEAMDLMPIAIRLCRQGNFSDAEKLVGYLRHLLAD